MADSPTALLQTGGRAAADAIWIGNAVLHAGPSLDALSWRDSLWWRSVQQFGCGVAGASRRHPRRTVDSGQCLNGASALRSPTSRPTGASGRNARALFQLGAQGVHKRRTSLGPPPRPGCARSGEETLDTVIVTITLMVMVLAMVMAVAMVAVMIMVMAIVMVMIMVMVMVTVEPRLHSQGAWAPRWPTSRPIGSAVPIAWAPSVEHTLRP